MRNEATTNSGSGVGSHHGTNQLRNGSPNDCRQVTAVNKG